MESHEDASCVKFVRQKCGCLFGLGFIHVHVFSLLCSHIRVLIPALKDSKTSLLTTPGQSPSSAESKLQQTDPVDFMYIKPECHSSAK